MKLIEQTKQWVARKQMAVLKSFGKMAQNSQFSISFCDTHIEIVRAFEKFFHDCVPVEILHGNILNLSCDALVSLANSFGDMGGGLIKRLMTFMEDLRRKK
ncbi:predicted phosphatase homologous to the C-terminal domain of histone macroH2A1 [Candidatus Moduliflexus flocculans]|uniref:Predicted phosphatase homologous to the C-terminal domain of histone macroH2A1 n=1 Tax=Candidatus Moduliflexus flocculans TaxID=1499966 RepID=A0A0S6VQU5_9BACT|nr:predicted phosphatase homologous to the C-terminal domain of histone macroH2A1 [Candidatus Moduliflexus flocculans]